MKRFTLILDDNFLAFECSAQINFTEVNQGDDAFNKSQTKTAINKYFIPGAFDGPIKKSITFLMRSDGSKFRSNEPDKRLRLKIDYCG